MIGVVVPAHNEADHIAAAIAGIARAAQHPGLHGQPVQIVVVADACTDDTRLRAEAAGAATMVTTARNVGMARAVGADGLLAHGARWLAFTDADTIVADDWLVAQLAVQSAVQADAVCGCVWVQDWSAHGAQAPDMAAAFDATYCQVDGHHHIHGANLGVAAQAYRRAGGFSALETSEDVALVQALQRSGANVVFSAAPRVYTSARLDHRAPLGFGDALRQLSERLPSLGVAGLRAA
jgi:glycosyltransferase involved in cell wall biosynthesis